jgi:DNA topoisomerase VI subunit A|tara:strand:+ start:97 stop:282 length:186 start_codon:yes stop_codon:yes gene_type:complete
MIKDALIKKVEADIEMGKAELNTFFENPQGVAEHIDYIETVEKKVQALALAQAKLDALKSL